VTLILYFLGGVLAGEAFQWATWKGGHRDQRWRGYWNVGLPHLIVNLTIVLGVLAAWHCGLLAYILGMFGFTPIAQLLSISPPWGFLVAMLADIMGDKIAYVLRNPAGRFLGKMVPKLQGGTP
jgi:hypothetical protein